jgi:hypothetical protein
MQELRKVVEEEEAMGVADMEVVATEGQLTQAQEELRTRRGVEWFMLVGIREATAHMWLLIRGQLLVDMEHHLLEHLLLELLLLGHTQNLSILNTKEILGKDLPLPVIFLSNI